MRTLADRFELTTLAARFWPKVERPGPGACWPWKTADMVRRAEGAGIEVIVVLP